jgi:aryl-alcohol dehydrogenase-like predicted oxidoreductase
MHLARLSQTEIAQDINESLAHLQTDIIDLYWLHRDDPAVPVAELVETLNEQVQAGKIRYFGCSNWRPQRMAQANDYAATHEMSGFVASQPLWSLAVPNQEALFDAERLVVFDQAAYEFHRQTGLAVIPYSAQGKGFFSKLDTLGAQGLSETDRAGYSNETNTRRWSRVKQLAEKYGRPVSHVVLSYLTSQPFVTIPIAGCRTLDQLKDSVTAVDLGLTPEDLNFLVADT